MPGHLPLLTLLLALALTSGRPAAAQTVPQDFSVEVVHAKPGVKSLGFAFLPDERIFVIGHHNGEVRLLVDGVMREAPIGVIPELTTSSESGLLGIAVDPDWPEAPFLYLYYTSSTAYNRVSKFRVDGAVDDPASSDLTLDLASEQMLMELRNDWESHNAGTLRFGSDKTLYVSHGDDGNWRETDDAYLQDLTNPYGKILRINRDGTAASGNPTFPEEPGGRLPEIFAIGLRNPFRFAIDPHTDRLFIGDVGTDIREEFNLSEGGENFGYPRHEGSSFFQQNFALIGPEPTPPIYDYAYHSPSYRTAIALATYRAKNYPSDNSFPPPFDGVHFYVDYFNGSLNYLRPDGDGGWESVSLGSGFNNLTDGAVGPDGGLYLISYNGPLRKVVYDGPSVAAEDAPVAAAFELRQNHPNPFDRSTTITYRLGTAEHVQLDVFDLLGRRVATLVDGRQAPGVHAARFDGVGLAHGTYVYRLRAGAATATKMMVRLGP